jgi:hypothetical protein
MPEFDPDVAGKTWDTARKTIINLYGSCDETPRIRLQELMDYCRDSNAKCSLENISDVQQYLRGFMAFAAPLVKQRDINNAERDFYFIAGLPTRLKEAFIFRVPEAQRERSNPPSIADSVSILQELLGEDSLFPGLWTSATPNPSRVVQQLRIPESIPADPMLSLPIQSVYFDPIPLNLSQTLRINEHLEYFAPERDSLFETISTHAAIHSIPNIVAEEQGMHQIHAIKQDIPLDSFEESRIYHCYSEHQADLLSSTLNVSEHSISSAGLEFEFLEVKEHNPSTIDTMGDIEAAVRELNYLNKLFYILDPEELSQSSSLVSQVQDFLNSFNFSEDAEDRRCEDQVSELEFPHTEAEDHSERELNISELSRSHSFDFSSESGADSITDLDARNIQ